MRAVSWCTAALLRASAPWFTHCPPLVPTTQWAVVPVWSTNLVPATQLKHWMNLCLFTCVSYLPEYLIAGHVARNHNYLVLTCAACRVPGPVDDKFICLIPTSHAIQHQRRPQTFALLTRRASSNLVIFFLYSVQEIIFSCSFTYIIGGPRVPEFHVKTPTSPQNQSKNDHLGQ